MIIASAKMNVRTQVHSFFAHDKRYLGVGLQFNEAVDHLNAGTLHIARPFDISLFVKSRFEFDKGRDGLA